MTSPTGHQRWVTFDCYGTLVDWHAGFHAILRPIAGAKTDDLLHEYHQCERQLEAERPHRLYTDVLTTGLARAARKMDVPMTESQTCALPQQWAALPVFADIPDALAGLRSAGWNLAVLTNCDEALFAQTQRLFSRPFDLVITAERVQDYKPSLSHFRCFEQTTGVRRTDWIHVACSWFHDIAPAQQLGLQHIWLDRDGEAEKHHATRLRLDTAVALPATILQLVQRGG